MGQLVESIQDNTMRSTMILVSLFLFSVKMSTRAASLENPTSGNSVKPFPNKQLTEEKEESEIINVLVKQEMPHAIENEGEEVTLKKEMLLKNFQPLRALDHLCNIYHFSGNLSIFNM